MANPIVNSTALTVAGSANGICQSQTPLAAGYLTLNGALVASGVASLTAAGCERVVIITSVADETARTFTVVGTNADGTALTASVAGANAGAATLPVYFRTVSSVYVDAATAGALTVGTTGVGASRPLNVDTALNPSNVTVAATVAGTVNYTLQYTIDSLQGTPLWVDDAGATAQVANKIIAYTLPIAGVRAKINSGTGSVTTTLLQSGLGS